MTTELATVDRSRRGGALVKFSAEDVETIRGMVANGLSDSELRVFLARCEHTGLDPLAGQIVAIKRWDARQKREVMAIQVTIDGLRSKAQETGEYDGQDPPQWCGTDGKWRDVWLDERPPAAARVSVYRRGLGRPIIGIATFNGYCQYSVDPQSKQRRPASRWATDPSGMLAKCAEAMAFRKAFPQQTAWAARERLEVEGTAVRILDAPEDDELASWRRLWFKTVDGSHLDSDEARYAFIAEHTQGATGSLAEFLADSTDEERAELIKAAAAAIAKAQPPRLQGRNAREREAADEFYASSQYRAQAEPKTPEQTAAGARKYGEIFGADDQTEGVIEGESREISDLGDDAAPVAGTQPAGDESTPFGRYRARLEGLGYGDDESYAALLAEIKTAKVEGTIDSNQWEALKRLTADAKRRIGLVKG